jgi:hypothetical protein
MQENAGPRHYPEPFSAAALPRAESRGLGASSIDAPEVRIVHSMEAVRADGVAFLSRRRAAKLVKLHSAPGNHGECHSIRVNTMAGLGTRFAQSMVTGSTARVALFTELLWFKRQHFHRPPSARAAPFRRCKFGPSRVQTSPPARLSSLHRRSGTLGRAAIRAGNSAGG